MDAYKEDLAYIHDTGFGDFAKNAAPGLLKTLKESDVKKGTVVDLACGGGLWAARLAEAGYEIVGIDISAAMIQMARQRLPGAKLHVGSYLDFAFPTCDAVTSLGEGFNYLFDESNSLKELSRLFGRIYEALRPGGLLIFDVATPERHRDKQQSHRAGDDWAVMVDYEHDKKHQRLTRRITAFRKVGKFYRRSDEVHIQQLYDPPAISKELRRVGFRVRLLRSYGKEKLPPGITAFLARKAD